MLAPRVPGARALRGHRGAAGGDGAARRARTGRTRAGQRPRRLLLRAQHACSRRCCAACGFVGDPPPGGRRRRGADESHGAARASGRRGAGSRTPGSARASSSRSRCARAVRARAVALHADAASPRARGGWASTSGARSAGSGCSRRSLVGGRLRAAPPPARLEPGSPFVQTFVRRSRRATTGSSTLRARTLSEIGPWVDTKRVRLGRVRAGRAARACSGSASGLDERLAGGLWRLAARRARGVRGPASAVTRGTSTADRHDRRAVVRSRAGGSRHRRRSRRAPQSAARCPRTRSDMPSGAERACSIPPAALVGDFIRARRPSHQRPLDLAPQRRRVQPLDAALRHRTRARPDSTRPPGPTRRPPGSNTTNG